MNRHDPACDVAHGEAPTDATDTRVLVAVYANGVASYLLQWGRELGYSTVLLEPDPTRVTPEHRAGADEVVHDPADVDAAGADVVFADHHRDDIGPMMAPLVRAGPRWIGIMGSPRHQGAHRELLAAEGVEPALIETVRRPIGLDIGSKEPAEIALSTLAGLLAHRNGRDGGYFDRRDR